MSNSNNSNRKLNLDPAQKLRVEKGLRANPIARESITKMIQWVAAEAQYPINLGIDFESIAECADQLHMSLFDIVDCDRVTGLRSMAPIVASTATLVDDKVTAYRMIGPPALTMYKAYRKYCEDNGCFFICALGTASTAECQVTGETGLCTEYVSVNVPSPRPESPLSTRQRKSAELLINVLLTLEKEAREEAAGYSEPTGPMPGGMGM